MLLARVDNECINEMFPFRWCFNEMSAALRHWEHKESTITMIGGNERLSRSVRKIRKKQQKKTVNSFIANLISSFSINFLEQKTITRRERVYLLPSATQLYPLCRVRIYLVENSTTSEQTPRLDKMTRSIDDTTDCVGAVSSCFV